MKHAITYLFELLATRPRMHSSVGSGAGTGPAGSPHGSAEGAVRIPTLSECLSTTFSPTSAVLSAEALTVPGDSPPAGTLEDTLFEGMPVDHEGASPHKRRAASQSGPPAPTSVEQQGFLVAITDMLRGNCKPASQRSKAGSTRRSGRRRRWLKSTKGWRQ